MNRPSLPALICLTVPGLAFTLFLLPLPHGWAEGWRGELINRLHAPLMGLCCLAIAALLRRPGRSGMLPAAVCTALMAALVELVQPWFHRTASLGDFGWGMAGVLGGCLWLEGARLRTALSRRVLRLLAVACALAPPMLSLCEVALIRAEADRVFPILADAENLRLQPLWSVDPAPAAAHPMSLARDAGHPASLHLDALDRDWSEFDTLEIAGTLEAAAAVEVGVRLDLESDGKTRLRAGGMMQPGTSVLHVPWPRTLPPRRVHQLVVFLPASPAAARLRIQSLRLTSEAGTPDAEPRVPATIHHD